MKRDKGREEGGKTWGYHGGSIVAAAVLHVHPLVEARLARELASALALEREQNWGLRRQTSSDVAERAHGRGDDVVAEGEKEHVDESRCVAHVDLARDLLLIIMQSMTQDSFSQRPHVHVVCCEEKDSLAVVILRDNAANCRHGGSCS